MMPHSILTGYEAEAITLLTSSILSTEQLDAVLRENEFVGYEYTGSGYFLKVRHPCAFPLKSSRAMIQLLWVVHRTYSVAFIVYIGNGELTLECHSWEETNIPDDFRQMDVRIEVV